MHELAPVARSVRWRESRTQGPLFPPDLYKYLTLAADDAGGLLAEFGGAQAVPARDPHPRGEVRKEGIRKKKASCFSTQSLTYVHTDRKKGKTTLPPTMTATATTTTHLLAVRSILDRRL